MLAELAAVARSVATVVVAAAEEVAASAAAELDQYWPLLAAQAEAL